MSAHLARRTLLILAVVASIAAVSGLFGTRRLAAADIRCHPPSDTAGTCSDIGLLVPGQPRTLSPSTPPSPGPPSPVAPKSAAAHSDHSLAHRLGDDVKPLAGSAIVILALAVVTIAVTRRRSPRRRTDSQALIPTKTRQGGGRLIRNTGITTIAAGGGVVSGLLLDVSIAAAFGAGKSTDAFFVAARLPIGIASVVMAGANQALVPAASTWLARKGEQETSRLVSLLFTATLFLGGLLSLLVAVVAWPLMRVTAPGLSASAVNQAASLARIMFLLVPLVSGAEVLRAYLNARHAFGAPAAMNIVMNGLAAVLVLTVSHHHIFNVAWAYVIGALAQLLFMLAMAYRRGLRYRPSLAVNDPELIGVAKLCGRPLLGAGLNPVARVVEQLFVSFLPSGSITILNYANRLISAIGGTVFFRSVMVVLLPSITEASAKADEPAVAKLTNTGIRIMLALAIPLTAFMAVLARPGALIVFSRGHFSHSEAALLGTVLAIFALNLVGDAVQRALLAPFYGRLDMRTPLHNSIYGVVANLVLLPICVLPFAHGDDRALYGVALAYSLAQYVNVGHAWYRVREIVPKPMAGIGVTAARLVAASAIAAATMVAGTVLVHLNALDVSRLALFGRTLLVGLGGAAALLLGLALFGGPESAQVLAGLRRRPIAAVDP